MEPVEAVLRVKKATVLLRHGHPDVISLDLEAPSAFPAMGYVACARIEAGAGNGISWLRTNLPELKDVTEVIDTRRVAPAFTR
jgi:hypothetical protein